MFIQYFYKKSDIHDNELRLRNSSDRKILKIDSIFIW